MITVTWIAVECWHEYIAREGPAKFLENIFIPVVLNVGKHNTMPLLQVAKSPRRRDILKITATVIAKHPLGQKRFEVRITQPHIDSQPTLSRSTKFPAMFVMLRPRPAALATSLNVPSWLLWKR